MFKNFFKIKPRSFLGIDIGTCSIRIAELERKGKEIMLSNYGEAITTLSEKKSLKTFGKDPLLFSDDKIAEDIRSICKEAGINTKDANFAIPDFCSFYTTFVLPEMAKEEVYQAVQYEVRPYIPLPLSEITLDWIITEGEPSKTPLRVLVVAIPNDVISRYQGIAIAAGLNLRILEPEVFSLARATVESGEESTKTVGLIDIGARSTTCSILDKGVLKSSHSFNLGGNELTGTLARSLNISYNESEEIKRTSGMMDLGGHSSKSILTPLIDSILEESKKVFRDYYKQEGKEIQKIILFGGSSLMPGMKEYIAEETKKEVSFADPFKEISYPPVLKKSLKEKRMLLSIPIGLALKELK